MRKFLLVLAAVAAVSGCRSTREFHGYVPDQALPTEVKPDVDTRSTVLARLGSPSTESVFDDSMWIYMSTTRENKTYHYPKVVSREVVAIQFDEQDVVSDVMVYNLDDGRVVQYSSRVTPTRGRELGILEQLFGSVGSIAGQIPGQQRQRQPGE